MSPSRLVDSYRDRPRARLAIAAGIGAILALVGCEPGPEARDAETVRALEEGCDREVDRLVDAVQAHVDRFAGMSAHRFVTEVGSPDDALQPAIQRAYDQLALQGCDTDRAHRRMAEGLGTVRADGGVATAVADVVRRTLLEQPEPGPRELLVGVHDDLAAMAATAPIGSTLTLAPGEHHLSEPVLIPHHLVLEGAGRDETELHSTNSEGAVLVLETGALELSGVTVKQDGPVAGAIVQVGSTVYTLRDLRITGAAIEDGEGGVGLHLGGEQGGQAAFAAELPGRLDRQIEDIEVLGNEGPGVLVTGTAAPVIRSSRVEGNGECGICYLGEVGGTLEDSEIVGNDARGVMIIGNGTVVLRGNRIDDHPEAGLVVGGAAQPHLDGNVIEGNDIGVWVEADAVVTITDNDIRGPGVVGLALTGTSSGTVVDNRIEGLAVGVEVRGEASPVLSGNLVVDSEEAAIVLRDAAAPAGGANRCEGSPFGIVVVDDEVGGSLEDGECDRQRSS